MIHIFVLFLFGATSGKFQRERKINMVVSSLLCLCLLKADEFLSSLGEASAKLPLRTSLGSRSTRGTSFVETERMMEKLVIFQWKFIFPWEVSGEVLAWEWREQ